jgi:tripeptide aminopeptidase
MKSKGTKKLKEWLSLSVAFTLPPALQHTIMKTLKERFLNYVSFDTQSDPSSETFPSTAKQLALLNALVEEMAAMGLSEVGIDAHGYATATLPATPGREDKPVIGWIAHVDTSPDLSGKNVRPQVIEHYDGTDIRLNDSVTMRVADFPELSHFRGHTLITTDGTTLLGADDKAGVAEILTAAEYLLAHPEIPHGTIRLGFTPDEEIGRGVDFFDVERFGARFAYTVDGSAEGELEYENFNAASARLIIQGCNIHPGYAKDRMTNALQVAWEFHTELPEAERPEHTEGYEGFFHLLSVYGTVERAEAEYIVRDHSRKRFEERKALMQNIAGQLNEKYGANTVALVLTDQYYNMKEKVEPFPEVIEKAKQAMREAGVVPVVKPIRGGTDGARLSYMGLPCPNLFTGGMNFHGRFECCSVQVMEKAVRTLTHLARLWSE